MFLCIFSWRNILFGWCDRLSLGCIPIIYSNMLRRSLDLHFLHRPIRITVLLQYVQGFHSLLLLVHRCSIESLMGTSHPLIIFFYKMLKEKITSF
jgi:predicted membrane chloride channel (bestrophin family)